MPGPTANEYLLYDGTPQPGCQNCVDFGSVTTTGFADQDSSNGTVAVIDQGATLSLTGNRWQATSTTYTVTPNTVLEFEFKSDSPGEIHGIGFDEDNVLSPERIFKFYGTEPWGLEDVAEYYYPGEFQFFHIPVGDFYTGQNMRLVFANDKDGASFDNTGLYRNVRVFEDTTPPVIKTITVDGSGETLKTCDTDVLDFHLTATVPWLGEDSADGKFGVPSYRDGCRLDLIGNRWRGTHKTYDLWDDSILELNYSMARFTSEDTFPELVGIGFSNNETIDSENFIKITGTEDWGITDHAKPVNAAGGLFQIPVGQLISGQDVHMVFVQDDDAGTSNTGSSFSTVRLYRASEGVGDAQPCQPIVRGTGTGPGNATLNWTLQWGASSYRMRYTPASTGTDNFIDVPAGTTSYTVNDLTIGENYNLAVSAVNAFGNSMESSSVDVTIPASSSSSSSSGGTWQGSTGSCLPPGSSTSSSSSSSSTSSSSSSSSTGSSTTSSSSSSSSSTTSSSSSTSSSSTSSSSSSSGGASCTTIATGGTSGNFNTTGPYCFRVQSNVSGWGVSNFQGRSISVTVNGAGTTVTTVGAALPAKSANDYYHFNSTAGSYAWASVYWW